MTDLIIVGRGLAATTLMHQFQQRNVSFIVIGNPNLSRSSQVAAGIWNPVVFKRLTKSWLADDLVPALLEFYSACEKKLGVKLLSRKNILKSFNESQEEKLWQGKAKNELDEYLDTCIYEASAAPSGTTIQNNFGKVMQSGALDVNLFLESSAQFFKEQIVNETFDYNQLVLNEEGVLYKEHKAKGIVFCEGWLVKDNPFFNWIPLKPAKGEVLNLKIPDLSLPNEILNLGTYFLETAPGVFKTGATYEWKDLNDELTVAAKEELLDKLKNHTANAYTILSQEAGVRPATVDRRPVLGVHPKHKQLFVFNGLGTKGVMLAPFFSNKFVNFYLQNQNPGDAVTVNRFYHFYEEKTQGQGHRKT